MGKGGTSASRSRRPQRETTGQERAGLYARVSTSRQEDNSSLSTQEQSCRAHCGDRGYEVVGSWTDVHTGADVFGRPGLSALREAVRARQLDVVVAHALDRLSRSQAHVGLLLTECEAAGVRLELVTEALEDSPEGRFFLAARSFVSEIERLKITERTQRGCRARVAAGKPLAGPRPPYGYRWQDPATKERLVEDGDTAVHVRRMFRQVAAGSSARQVALALTREGIPTPTGKPVWSTQTVSKLLKHPVYVGEATALRWEYVRERGRPRRQTQRAAGSTVLPGVAPALVDKAVADAAIARLPLNQRRASRNNRNPESALLRGGFVSCGYCGRSLSVRPINGVPYYTCHSNDRYGCPRFGIAVHLLEPAIWSRVERVLTRPEIIAVEVERRQGADPFAADLAALDRRMADIAVRRQRLARAVAALDDEDAAEPLLAELRALGEQARTLETERVDLASRQAIASDEADRLDGLVAWCRRVEGNLPNLGYDERRLVLDALGARVTVWRSDHEPRWQLDMAPVPVDVVGGTQPSIASPSVC